MPIAFELQQGLPCVFTNLPNLVPIDPLAPPASVVPATWSALAENECKNFDIPLPLSDENR